MTTSTYDEKRFHKLFLGRYINSTSKNTLECDNILAYFPNSLARPFSGMYDFKRAIRTSEVMHYHSTASFSLRWKVEICSLLKVTWLQHMGGLMNWYWRPGIGAYLQYKSTASLDNRGLTVSIFPIQCTSCHCRPYITFLSVNVRAMNVAWS